MNFQLSIPAGSLFGNATSDPRRDLKKILSRITPKQRGQILELAQKLGAVELTARIQKLSAWKL
jgi:hypothetical protein